MGRWSRAFYLLRQKAIDEEFKAELARLYKEEQKMKCRIYQTPQAPGQMFVLQSVQYPDNAAVISLPTEFDQELFLERCNCAFDTLASGLKVRYGES